MPPFQYDQSGELIGLLQRLNSPGFMMMYAGPTAPGGWLFTDGSLVLQADFPDLYLVIGNTYNTGGEPAGTFRLPNTLSRSPIGVGQGAGLSNYVLGQIGGEEAHQLLISEMPTHTHLQNTHTHLQDSHNHLQDSHNHIQNAHTHTQDPHTHTQNAHTHIQNSHGHNMRYGAITGSGSTILSGTAYGAGSPTIGNINEDATAVNQNSTATNNNSTATNQNTTATNVATTATNQATTATNQNTVATNQNEGGSGSHNTLHPYLAINFIIKY